MYQSLLEMEKKLDWTMTRKRVEVQDTLARNPTVCLSLTRIMLHGFAHADFVDNTDTEGVCEPHGIWSTVAR